MESGQQVRLGGYFVQGRRVEGLELVAAVVIEYLFWVGVMGLLL